MYHKKNVDFTYLLWEDFVYQVEHKDAKKHNEMYYPRFTKVIGNFFMTKDQSIPRRNNKSESYKEYYVIALGAEPPKTKTSVRKKQSSSDTTMPPPTATGKRLKTSAKKSSKDDDDDEKISEHDDEIDDQSDDDDQDDDDDDEKTESDNDGDDFVHPKFSTHDEEDKDEESFDPIVQTPSQVENTNDEYNDKDSHGMNVEGDEGANEEDEANELYRDVNINLKGQQQSSSVSSRFISNMLNPNPDIAPSPANGPSSSIQDLPNFGSLFGFDHRLKTLETNFSEFIQTNQFAEAISLIPSIVDKYIDHQMNEAVKVVVRLQSNRLRDEAQAENELSQQI
nr:hypothetical protein [Tanacetum cinerariifolium]